VIPATRASKVLPDEPQRWNVVQEVHQVSAGSIVGVRPAQKSRSLGCKCPGRVYVIERVPEIRVNNKRKIL
jgi:hypothetical protein